MGSIESDGFIRNRTLRKDVGGDDIANYGFTALWEPTDNFNIKLHYEKFHDDSEQGAYHNRNTPAELTCGLELGMLTTANGCVATTLDDEDHNSANGTNDSDNEYDTVIATMNWDFENFLLTYIGTSRDMDEENNQHFGGANVQHPIAAHSQRPSNRVPQ